MEQTWGKESILSGISENLGDEIICSSLSRDRELYQFFEAVEHIATGKENQCRQYSSNHTKQDCLDMKALRSSGKRVVVFVCLFVFKW